MNVLLEMTAHASVLIVLTALLRALCLHKLPKRTFTALWLVAAARMVLPLSLTVPAPAAPVSAVYRAVAQAAPAQKAAARFPWMAALWGLGAAVCAGWFLICHALALRRYREALPLRDAGVDRLCRNLAPHRAVSVRLCQGLGTPLTYGLIHPVILLPADLDRADRRQLGFILAHELTHIRRFHIPFKYLLALAVSLHWFNPLAWLMYALANRDIELVCDEAVLRRTRDGRAGYAMALIGLEERRAAGPLLSAFGAKAVRERIRQIMLFRPAGAVSLATAVVLVLCSATVFAAAAEAAPRLSEGFVIPTPTPYAAAVTVAPTEEPQYNYVNPTPEPTELPLTPSPAPTAAAIDAPAQVYRAPAVTATPQPAEEPALTPESTPAPMEAAPVYTPEPTQEPEAAPTPGEASASPAPWPVEVLPTPVTGGPDPMTPLPPDAPVGPTPAPVPQALYPTPEPTGLPL